MPRTFSLLTEGQARAIIADANACPRCGEPKSMKRLASEHGTSPSTVSRLLSGAHRLSHIAEIGGAN